MFFCVVNNEEITNKDVILTEILNGEKRNVAKGKTIEQKVILQKLKNDNFVLDEKQNVYINNLIEGLKSDAELNSRYSEKEKNELIANVSEKLYNDALIEQHRAEFINQLANKTFSADDEEITEKYKECLKIQEKWDNREGIAYAELTGARDAVYNAYVQKLVSASKIE